MDRWYNKFNFIYKNNKVLRSLGIFIISTNIERRMHFKCYFQQLKLKKLAKIEKNNHQKSFKYNLAIVAIMKNEGQYLAEWIEYHKMLGVDKFILYNHDSNDNTYDVLNPYIESGLVEYHFVSTPNSKLHHPQKEVYTDAVMKYRTLVKWMGFIDVDEFIVPEGGGGDC